MCKNIMLARIKLEIVKLKKASILLIYKLQIRRCINLIQLTTWFTPPMVNFFFDIIFTANLSQVPLENATFTSPHAPLLNRDIKRSHVCRFLVQTTLSWPHYSIVDS